MQTLLMIGTGPDWPSQKLIFKSDHGIDAIGLDILPAFKPDYIRDINRGLPFSNDTFDEIRIFHVLEHLGGFAPMYPIDNYDFAMNELHRVLKPGGILDIEVPYWRDDIAVEAAGHIRLFAENSFINYYSNPYWQEMGQCHFSECISNVIAESGRSGENPARVIKIKLKK